MCFMSKENAKRKNISIYRVPACKTTLNILVRIADSVHQTKYYFNPEQFNNFGSRKYTESNSEFFFLSLLKSTALGNCRNLKSYLMNEPEITEILTLNRVAASKALQARWWTQENIALCFNNELCVLCLAFIRVFMQLSVKKHGTSKTCRMILR